MSSCADSRAQASRSPEPATLFHIGEGYRTRWNNLTFSVESGSNEWTLQVQDAEQSETLYKGQRMGVRAAQVAAAEYAIFRMLGVGSRVGPAQLASELNWQPYW